MFSSPWDSNSLLMGLVFSELDTDKRSARSVSSRNMALVYLKTEGVAKTALRASSF